MNICSKPFSERYHHICAEWKIEILELSFQQLRYLVFTKLKISCPI